MAINTSFRYAVIMEFSYIQLHLIRDIHAKFGIPYSPQSPDIGQNSDGSISDFWFSGQEIVITLEPVMILA